MMFFIYFLTFVASVMSESNLKLLKTSNDQFTATMFQEVIKNNPGKSVVLSAFSVLPPLAQLSLASVGASRDEIYEAIGLFDENSIKEQFTNMTKNLQLLKGVELDLANKVYIREGEALNEQFAVVSREVFNTEAQNIDFSKNVEAAQEINTWVENNTNHRIKNFISPNALDTSTAAVLVNAIYFKGKWSNTFDQLLSWNDKFHVNKNETIQIRMMQQKTYFKYGESEELDAKLLEMTYEGKQSSFLVILPKQIDGISTLVEKLKDPAMVSKAVEDMQFYEVSVRLPKFEIETSLDLKKILKNMKVTKLFEPSEAQLYNMLKGRSDLSISAAVQKAYIAVTEDGSEASAANAYMMMDGMAPGGVSNPNLKHFKADHPFYFELQIDNMIAFNGIFAK